VLWNQERIKVKCHLKLTAKSISTSFVSEVNKQGLINVTVLLVMTQREHRT
jgi:hypothetical protein